MSCTSDALTPGMPRHALVTGCSRGLGLEIARRLVSEGFRVAVVCRRLDDAKRTARALGPTCCEPIQLDLTDGEAAVRAAASEVVAWLGASRLMLLVNNAGNSHGAWDEESWAASRSVNYKGPCLLTEALLPSFARGASVTMVGSGLGELTLLSPKFQRLLTTAKSIADLDQIASRAISALSSEHSWVGPYGLSKALIHRATEIFASNIDFKKKGILVNAVCPGWVSTDMGGEQAPISVEEGSGHILEKALNFGSSVTGTFVCYCYKNYDEEHNRAWEEKHGVANPGSGMKRKRKKKSE
mmetsp:Transcript_41693/g.134821  ORF Transcript_41693/g.134821 Transcript_41693/m.134821 type:complete len:299 (+) Transcript_41693:58-954(+)